MLHKYKLFILIICILLSVVCFTFGGGADTERMGEVSLALSTSPEQNGWVLTLCDLPCDGGHMALMFDLYMGNGTNAPSVRPIGYAVGMTVTVGTLSDGWLRILVDGTLSSGTGDTLRLLYIIQSGNHVEPVLRVSSEGGLWIMDADGDIYPYALSVRENASETAPESVSETRPISSEGEINTKPAPDLPGDADPESADESDEASDEASDEVEIMPPETPPSEPETEPVPYESDTAGNPQDGMTDMGSEDASRPATMPDTVASPEDTPLPSFIGCRNEDADGNTFAVSLLFWSSKTDVSPAVVCLGRDQSDCRAVSLTIDRPTGTSATVCTYRGLSTGGEYTFLIYTADGVTEVVYRDGAYISQKDVPCMPPGLQGTSDVDYP